MLLASHFSTCDICFLSFHWSWASKSSKSFLASQNWLYILVYINCWSTFPYMKLCSTDIVFTIVHCWVNTGQVRICSCVHVNRLHNSHNIFCRFAFWKLYFTWIVLERNLNNNSRSVLVNLLSFRYGEVDSLEVS